MSIRWIAYPDCSLPHTLEEAAKDVKPIQQLAQTYFALPPDLRQRADDLMQQLQGEAYNRQVDCELYEDRRRG